MALVAFVEPVPAFLGQRTQCLGTTRGPSAGASRSLQLQRACLFMHTGFLTEQDVVSMACFLRCEVKAATFCHLVMKCTRNKECACRSGRFSSHGLHGLHGFESACSV